MLNKFPIPEKKSVKELPPVILFETSAENEVEGSEAVFEEEVEDEVDFVFWEDVVEEAGELLVWFLLRTFTRLNVPLSVYPLEISIPLKPAPYESK